ncbi:MAG: arsenic efflux protein [Atopobiaceae bacterium]|nr:arsenic efflux protein [Atopobiaceae bacterium]
MEMFLDVLVDGAKDTLTLVPFLFVTYLVMEIIEHSSEGKAEGLIRRAGAAGPAVGGLLGAVPQCGFSAMAATLYAGRLITAGTLVAVILSTSDELVPVFLAHGEPVGRILTILAVKVAIGVVVGFAADAALRALHRTGDGHPHIKELCERAHCHCGEIDESHEHDDKGHANANGHGSNEGHAHGHEHAHGKSRVWHIVRCALQHTLQVSVFIFVITVAFGLVIEGVGEDALGAFLGSQPVLASFLAALIGLIPNCAASVAIAELYLEGTLATGPMLAGLLVSGGMGLLVLFRTNADMRQNVIITAFIYGVGVVCGLVATMLGVVI